MRRNKSAPFKQETACNVKEFVLRLALVPLSNTKSPRGLRRPNARLEAQSFYGDSSILPQRTWR